MGIGGLILVLVFAFVALGVLVVVQRSRRTAREAAARALPPPRLPAGRPRRGAFGVDDALTWSDSSPGPGGSGGPDGGRGWDGDLSWDADLDGYTDLSGGEPSQDGDQSSPSAASKAE